ncbi:hypothetical protein D0T12_31515 [Actinomadura spongiicola]|uniref:OmpA-like domain-containing protein n=1 Tax=Actinomadura spongiicola TaxID=2303421 RepID=A0A372G8L8_9ACTN|nr:hypothetical protein D0T12_31515 [Actinomadura spongiicola]
MVPSPSPRRWRRRIGRVLRGIGSALVLGAVTVGVPYLFVALAGSPIPERILDWDEILSTLSRRDDGTLFLGFLTYVAWGFWLIWIALLVLETGARLRGRPAPHIPGLDGPQRLAALLVTTLGVAVIGTTAAVSRASTLPSVPHNVAAAAPPPYTQSPSATTDSDSAVGGQYDSPSTLTSRVRPLNRDAAPGQSATRPQRHQVTVRFGFGSAQLSTPVKEALARTTRDIGTDADPAQPISIVGHTDAHGPADYNQRLSIQRARTVREALGELAAHGFRFEVSGKGERTPIAVETHADGSDDPSGRARNRRVEITYTLKTRHAPPASPTARPPHEQGDGNSGSPPPSPPATQTAPSQPTPPPTPSETATTSGIPSESATSQGSSPTSPPASTDHPFTVDLPSGAIVGLSFAAGVGTALVVTRLHRRRRHRTPATGPDLARHEPPPSPTIRRLRRVDLGREAQSSDPEQPPDEPSRLHLFPLPSSGRIVLGVRDHQEITVPIGGFLVGLKGPGGIAVARALLLTFLMHAGDHDVEILIPRSDASQVLALNPDQVEELTQYARALRVTADLNAALRLLASERIHRARLLDTAPDSQDLEAVRQADPTEPLPRLVLMATSAPEQQRRLEAVTVAASDYDIAIITLGEHPVGPTVHLDDAAQVTSWTGAGTDIWDGLRLFHIQQQDADQVLELIRSAHGAPEPESEPQPAAQTKTAARPPVSMTRSAPLVPQARGDRPVYLQVLGHPTVRVDGKILETGIRGKGRELLTHLAVHAEGASRDAIVAALWPDVDHKHAVMRFHALLHETRQTLKRATGRIDDNFIARTADRYGIDPELISVDLWRFHTSLHEASQAERDQDQAVLLQEAADTYQGHLAAEASFEQAYEWIEPERETLRRQAVEALIHLAILYERHEPERALTVLERARSLDRYAEEIYQHIMTLQAKLGRSDAVRRTYRLLETSLEDLAVDPSEETQQLLWRLLHPRGSSQMGQR